MFLLKLTLHYYKSKIKIFILLSRIERSSSLRLNSSKYLYMFIVLKVKATNQTELSDIFEYKSIIYFMHCNASIPIASIQLDN